MPEKRVEMKMMNQDGDDDDGFFNYNHCRKRVFDVNSKQRNGPFLMAQANVERTRKSRRDYQKQKRKTSKKTNL